MVGITGVIESLAQGGSMVFNVVGDRGLNLFTIRVQRGLNGFSGTLDCYVKDTRFRLKIGSSLELSVKQTKQRLSLRMNRLSRHYETMAKPLIGTVKLKELQVGKFANVNGTIVYRYMTDDKKNTYWFPPGIFIIEKHNHLNMGDAYRTYSDVGTNQADYGYWCDPIEVPYRFHVDQALNLLQKENREKKLNGLVYVENYETLKSYIRADEDETDNLLLNMMSGLEPQHLSEREKVLLKRRYGKNWLFKLGYQTNLEYLEQHANDTANKLLRGRSKH